MSASAMSCHRHQQSTVLLLVSDIVADFSCTYMLLKMFLIFTNEEYSKMHVVYGCCGVNGGLSAKLYERQFWEWLQKQLQILPDILFVSVDCFSCDFIDFTRNYHSVVRRSPREVIQSNFQQRFLGKCVMSNVGKARAWTIFYGGTFISYSFWEFSRN